MIKNLNASVLFLQTLSTQARIIHRLNRQNDRMLARLADIEGQLAVSDLLLRGTGNYADRLERRLMRALIKTRSLTECLQPGQCMMRKLPRSE